MSENRCLMCNEIIPEGRMVCPLCEQNVINDEYNPRYSREINMRNEKTKLLRNLKKSKFYDEDFDF